MVVSRLSAMPILEEPASFTDFGYVMVRVEGFAKMPATMMQE